MSQSTRKRPTKSSSVGRTADMGLEDFIRAALETGPLPKAKAKRKAKKRKVQK